MFRRRRSNHTAPFDARGADRKDVHPLAARRRAPAGDGTAAPTREAGRGDVRWAAPRRRKGGQRPQGAARLRTGASAGPGERHRDLFRGMIAAIACGGDFLLGGVGFSRHPEMNTALPTHEMRFGLAASSGRCYVFRYHDAALKPC
ncbi:MAG: hypothetical protein ICV73_23260 [Acetobacteraceae bacterium]|nr:hypothetical protein [Acetobacteraceae bacterium]